MIAIPFFVFASSLRCGCPADLESFGELFHGFSKEARIRGIPSLPFGGFGQSSYLETR
jgi:hypothetical protein